MNSFLCVFILTQALIVVTWILRCIYGSSQKERVASNTLCAVLVQWNVFLSSHQVSPKSALLVPPTLEQEGKRRKLHPSSHRLLSWPAPPCSSFWHRAKSKLVALLLVKAGVENLWPSRGFLGVCDSHRPHLTWPVIRNTWRATDSSFLARMITSRDNIHPVDPWEMEYLGMRYLWKDPYLKVVAWKPQRYCLLIVLQGRSRVTWTSCSNSQPTEPLQEDPINTTCANLPTLRSHKNTKAASEI